MMDHLKTRISPKNLLFIALAINGWVTNHKYKKVALLSGQHQSLLWV